MASVNKFLDQSLPAVHCRGTYYDVDYFIGHVHSQVQTHSGLV